MSKTEDDLHDGWKEDPGLDLDVDVENAPRSSQELASEVAADPGEEMSDDEFKSFLEDVFALPDETEDNVLETMDAACDERRKSEMHCDEALDFASNPKIRIAKRSAIIVNNNA